MKKQLMISACLLGFSANASLVVDASAETLCVRTTSSRVARPTDRAAVITRIDRVRIVAEGVNCPAGFTNAGTLMSSSQVKNISSAVFIEALQSVQTAGAPVLKDQRVKPAQLAPREMLVLKDHRESRVFKEPRDSRVSKVQSDHKAQSA